MSLFISQKDDRSELQKRIAAELQRKNQDKSLLADRPDLVDDSQYIKGTKSTSSFSWVWMVAVILATGFIIWLTVISMSR
ncbi:hypothetical protein HGB25_00905 [Candidatus Saccharibacteria bacterium]|nr:hypothetical protein [Candidatus Saccharibacteria bacterium]